MPECLIAIALAGFVGLIAVDTVEKRYQTKCIEKYSDMPHNKVTEYCTTLLKFEKDPK